MKTIIIFLAAAFLAAVPVTISLDGSPDQVGVYTTAAYAAGCKKTRIITREGRVAWQSSGKCGLHGPGHKVDPSFLTNQERESIYRETARASGACEYREFYRGRSYDGAIVFAPSNAAFDCPQNRRILNARKCINCTAFMNGHRGSVAGPVASWPKHNGQRGVAFEARTATNGVWVKKGYVAAWCPEISGSVSTYRFGSLGW